MRFLLSLSILSILIFSLSCKTTTENQTQVSSSVQQEKEESQEKPQSIVVPVASLGDVSETRKKILQNSLEDELKEYFSIISQERFEEAQEKAFEQLDYEECTEDQCIMMIQEMLQVENVFHLEVIGEGIDTQLSLSWRTLDEKKKETDFCEECKTRELNEKIGGLVQKLVGVKKEVVVKEEPPRKVDPVVVETSKVISKVVQEPVVQKIEKDKTKGMFVTVGRSGTILTSSNGISWTEKTSGTSKSLFGVTYSQ